MRIGELAKRSGYSRDTLRYYEKLGLISAVSRPNSSNNYRRYREDTARRLDLIKRAKAFGFTLQEIGKLIDDWESQNIDPNEMICIYRGKLEKLNRKITELGKAKADLEDKIDRLSRGMCNVG